MKKANKFIYIISPNRIKNRNFFKGLEEIFKSKKVKYFQLRLKNENIHNLIRYGKRIKKLCKKYKVKLIINDNVKVALKIGADGCHLGQADMKISQARKILKNKLLGVTCHNSIKLVKKEIKNQVDYIALGAFFKSSTKIVKYKAYLGLITKVKSITNIPIVAIGGINSINYKKLLLKKADFLAISGYIWNNKKLNPLEALKKLK